MATGIPLPGAPGESLMKGIDTGSNMFARIMHPILEREKNKQLAEQFAQTKALEKSKMAQLENHFQQQFGLSKAAAGRAALAASDAHKLALQKQDPLFAAHQYEALENYYKSKGQNQGQQMTQPQGMPTQEMGQGQGMFSPQGLQGAQQDAQAQQQANNNSAGGIDLELMKSHPMLRGFYKQNFGVDPLAAVPQTPEEKNASAIDLYRQKQAIKNGSIGDNVPLTTAMKTKLQGVVTGVDNSLPVIQDLITEFKKLPTGSETLNPAAYAAYNAQANSIIEPLINAFGLNVTDATKEMMHDQVFRKTNEPLKKYKDRIVSLAKEIIRRRDDSFKSLKSGAINPKSNFTNEFFEQLGSAEDTKMVDGKLFKKINGEWHD